MYNNFRQGKRQWVRSNPEAVVIKALDRYGLRPRDDGEFMYRSDNLSTSVSANAVGVK